MYLLGFDTAFEIREQFMGQLQGLKVGTKLDRPPTGLEPYAEFRERIGTWWKDQILVYAASAASPPAGVLVVSHGGCIDGLRRVLLGVERGVAKAEGVVLGTCFNASITVIEVEQESLKATFVKYCDISHLVGPVVQVNVDMVVE